MKYLVKDCDPNTGVPDDDGYDDEYVVRNQSTCSNVKNVDDELFFCILINVNDLIPFGSFFHCSFLVRPSSCVSSPARLVSSWRIWR